jgi:pimeloyl-ACP methyl ester carboxylesterase
MLVLLVHGLGRTPVSLFGLASALRRAGHHTRFFGYSPTFESLPRILRRLERRLHSLANNGRPVGLVGHSLGGLLLRLALDRVPSLRVHHFVMLGTPNRGSLMARQASRWLPFRLLTRECGRLLATASTFESLPELRVPHTVIAGTNGPRGRFLPLGREPNDWIVSVTETMIEPQSTIPIAASHTFMMNYSQVRARVLAAFAHGCDSSGFK